MDKKDKQAKAETWRRDEWRLVTLGGGFLSVFVLWLVARNTQNLRSVMIVLGLLLMGLVTDLLVMRRINQNQD